MSPSSIPTPTPMRPSTFALRLLGLLVVLALLSGCAAFDNHRQALERLHAQGRYDLAAHMLDEPSTRRLYAGGSEMLWRLERGAVALALDDADRCVELLEEAEREIERGRSASDTALAWTINDRAAAYAAEPYEDIYVNVLKLLAQLRAGRIQGGATVEARRLASKADLLRDQYLRYEDSLRREGGTLVSINPAADFIESPLGTYLSALAFMKSGNREFQRVAARRLLDSIRLQQGLIGPVRPEDFAHLEEAIPESATLLVVALSGRGPTKYAERVGPIPLGTFPLYFELPRLRVHPSRVARAWVEVRPAPGGGSEQHSLTERHPLALVEDLSLVALANHERILPLIHARTLLRYAVKAGLAAAGTELARRRAADRDQAWVQIAGAAAGLAFLLATESADLRCWSLLPGQARVATLPLPAGAFQARVVYESSDGRVVHASEWQTVAVGDPARALVALLAYYWD